MKYENREAGVLMIKILVGIDLIDSALTDMDIKASGDIAFIKSVMKAKKISAKVVADYDKMVGNGANANLLSKIYDKCNDSINWTLKKMCNL